MVPEPVSKEPRSKPMANIGEGQPSFFNIPWEIRKEIYKLAFGGHVILPRPDEPKPPSEEARNELGRLFGKIKASTTNPAFANIKDLKERFEAVVHAAIYGQNWNDEKERMEARLKTNTLLGWISACQRNYNETIEIIYATNIFDITLLNTALDIKIDDDVNSSSNNGNQQATTNLYKDQPKILTKFLPHIRSLHLSTRPLAKTAKAVNKCPDQCLARINHIVIDCATTTANHVPSSDVRHHIPHGKDWIALWGEISKKDNFKSLTSIETNVCGWRVPPGWRKEVLAPITEAAKSLGRLPPDTKRKATESADGEHGEHGEQGGDAPIEEDIKGKLVVNPKCQVKMFDVYVPWNESMVKNHNEASAHTYGFKLMADHVALDNFNRQVAEAGPNSRVDPGWQDTN